MIPGYRGHVPNVVNAVGMSTFLSGPGFTEVKVEDMEKMGGLGDLGDGAAAYGMVDAGASSVSDGANEFADNNGDGIVDSMQKGKDSLSQAGHIDQYTYGDLMADKAAAAVVEAAARKKKFDAAKRLARGF